jgi:hypothetical protein
MCDGIPGEGIFKWIRPNQFDLCRKGSDGASYCITSVGSIRHDLCCLKYPDGTYCNPYSRIASFWSEPSECACASEWRKAVKDLVHASTWIERYEDKLVSDPKRVSDWVPIHESREAWLPKTRTEWEETPNLRGIAETRVTLKLKAPADSHLDCPNSDVRCRLSCKDREGNCELNKKGFKSITFKQPIAAGDSQFCESGKFDRIAQRGNYRFGICSGEVTHDSDNKEFMSGYCDSQQSKIKQHCSEGSHNDNLLSAMRCSLAEKRWEQYCQGVMDGTAALDEAPQPSMRTRRRKRIPGTRRFRYVGPKASDDDRDLSNAVVSTRACPFAPKRKMKFRRPGRKGPSTADRRKYENMVKSMRVELFQDQCA